MLLQATYLCCASVIIVMDGDFVRKILIATTSEETSTYLSKALPQYNIHICNTGVEALALLENFQPDIIILELSLPFMDGISVLRKSRFRPPIILALTHIMSENLLHLAAEVGIHDIIFISCTSSYIADRLYALIEEAPSPEL